MNLPVRKVGISAFLRSIELAAVALVLVAGAVSLVVVVPASGSYNETYGDDAVAVSSSFSAPAVMAME